MNNTKSPYVGPRPFTKGDENIFYGRDVEAQALMSLIVSHPAVLLYSQSGAGKTSLLNAKVRRLLEARDVDVLDSSRVGGSLPPDVNPREIENIFVYFAVTSLEGERTTEHLCNSKTTLPEYLKTLPRRKRPDGGLVQQVIFFDQFEEIFTTSQPRWKDRDGFFEQVGQALEADKLLRVVFAMREEHLASLGVYVANLPERLRTRFHLERLRYEPALDAVTKPLEGTTRRFAKDVAEKLVRNLLRVPVRSESGMQEITGEFVEPVQLQVVCQNIWNSLPENVDEIDDKFVASYGDVDVALTNYYEDCLSRVIEKHTIKESRLRRWFDNELITVDGLRGTVYRGERTTGTLPNEVVSMLEDLRLVRAEPRGGALWYELTHDRFIAPIRIANRKWFSQQQGGLATVLETKVDEYRKDPRDENLIGGSELKNALEWLKTAESEDYEVSDSVREYILDSKTASARRRTRTVRQQVAALILALLGALVLAGWAYWQKGRADRARYDERADVADNFIKLKKYHDALVWGLKSVEPALTRGAAPSSHGLESLRSALKAVGGSVWSRPFSSRPRMVIVSPDGEFIFTTDDKELVLWKGADGKKIFNQQLTKEQDNPASGPKTAPGSVPEGSRIVSAFFSAAGNYLVILRGAGGRSVDPNRPSEFSVEIWDLRNNLRPIIKESGRYCQFAKDDSTVLIDANEKVRVIEVPSGKNIFSREEKSDLTILSPTGQQLVQVMKGAVVFRNFSQAEPKINQTAFPGSFGLYSSTFSDDGKKLVIFQDKDNDKSVLTLWDTESGERVSNTTINSKHISFDFKILSGSTAVLLVTRHNYFGDPEIPVAQIWDVTNNTITKINENVTSLTNDDLSMYLIRTDTTSRTILRDPRDQSSWVEFSELPETLFSFVPSRQLNAAVTLSADNVMQYWKPGSFSAEIDKLSPDQVYRTACKKLQYQEKEFQEVMPLCQPLLK